MLFSWCIADHPDFLLESAIVAAFSVVRVVRGTAVFGLHYRITYCLRKLALGCRLSSDADSLIIMSRFDDA